MNDETKKIPEGMPYVTEIAGQTVLVDPVAYSAMKAVEKHNCKNTLDLNADRVVHFKNRIAEKGLDPEKMAIVVINVDDPHGAPIAELLMPNFNWQEIRDKGEIPFARGLVYRQSMQEIINEFDEEAAKKMSETSGTIVVVVDHGVAEVFSADTP